MWQWYATHPSAADSRRWNAAVPDPVLWVTWRRPSCGPCPLSPTTVAHQHHLEEGLRGGFLPHLKGGTSGCLKLVFAGRRWPVGTQEQNPPGLMLTAPSPLTGVALHPDSSVPTHLHQHQLGHCHLDSPIPVTGESSSFLPEPLGVSRLPTGCKHPQPYPTWSSMSLQVRSRSLSFSEPQPPTPMLKSHLIVASPPRVPLGTR